ncbi:MAG: Ig-like domain-containing protein, partial [bacterium]
MKKLLLRSSVVMACWVTLLMSATALAQSTLRVDSISPAPGAIVGTTDLKITISFNQAIESQTANLFSFIIRGSGDDGILG